MSVKTFSLRLNQFQLDSLNRLGEHYGVVDNPSLVIKLAIQTQLDYIFRINQVSRQIDVQYGIIQELRAQNEAFQAQLKKESPFLHQGSSQNQQNEHSEESDERRMAPLT